jgi:hypothetical protein
MNSMTMHILGGLVQAAMNSTTLGCRSAVITRTYASPPTPPINNDQNFHTTL